MSNVVLFAPKPGIGAKENLAAFIKLCKEDLTVFGTELNWNDVHWKHVGCFGKMSVGVRGGAYVTYAKANPLDKDFIDFAKAYVRYQQTNRALSGGNDRRLAGLRAIEAALLRVTQTADITNLTRVVLDQATTLVMNVVGGEAQKASTLGAISDLVAFLSANRLVASAIGDWKRTRINVEYVGIKVGEEGDAYRKSKLPDPEVISAVIRIFCEDTKDLSAIEVFATSIIALLMCQPARISEPLKLKVACLEKRTDDQGTPFHCLAGYESAKLFGRNNKGIPTAMVSVADKAIARLTVLSAPGRKLAEHIESNPDRFYRHENCPDVAEDAVLTNAQACQALGLAENYNSVRVWLRARKQYFGTRRGSTLGSLWKILQQTARIKPDEKGLLWLNKAKRIRLKDALFCLRWAELGESRSTSPVELWVPRPSNLSSAITKSTGSATTIFEKRGMTKENGDPLSVTSHLFRHWLNTELQKAGVSQEIIAMWSGRKDVKQNRVYNQMTDDQKFEKTTKAMFPGAVKKVTINTPQTREEFEVIAKRHAGTIQHTEFGFCSHDYATSPCELYADCANCAEHFCVKGDAVKTAHIRKKLADVEAEAAAAERDLANGAYGADGWYKYHTEVVLRLRQLVTILDNPEVEDGAFIRLEGGLYSVHGTRAIKFAEEREEERLGLGSTYMIKK